MNWTLVPYDKGGEKCTVSIACYTGLAHRAASAGIERPRPHVLAPAHSPADCASVAINEFFIALFGVEYCPVFKEKVCQKVWESIYFFTNLRPESPSLGVLTQKVFQNMTFPYAKFPLFC